MVEVLTWAIFAGCAVAAFIAPIIGLMFLGQWLWNLVFADKGEG